MDTLKDFLIRLVLFIALMPLVIPIVALMGAAGYLFVTTISVAIVFRVGYNILFK